MTTPRAAKLTVALLLLGALFTTSCYQQGEAKTREEQESHFQAAFDFAAPSTIAEIRYMDVYQRNLMDGVYGQWLRCSYDGHVFERILKEGEYVPCTAAVHWDVQPEWWPKRISPKVAVYSFESKKSSGASYREYLWRDESSNYIYLYRIQGY